MRTAAVGILGLGYWVSASVAVGAATLARAASEDPPFSEERVLVWLTVVGWFAASAVGIGLVISMRRSAVLGFWLVQALVLFAAFVSTAEPGGVRVAPPLIVIALVAEVAGLGAILLRRLR